MKKRKSIFAIGIIIALFLLIPTKESSASEIDNTNTIQTIQAGTESIFFSPRLKGEKFAPDAMLSKYTKNIFPSDTEILEVYNTPEDCDISFESSDSSILAVEQISDTACQYTGVKSGSAKIIVKISKNNFLFFEKARKLKAKINISPRAASIKFRRATRKIKKGQKVKLGVTLRPSITKEKPTFWSKNKRIASVNKKGMVTGKKAGTTYITARISNGKTARCKIIVKKKKYKKEVKTETPKSTSTEQNTLN